MPEKASTIKQRPPVIAIMGHVDHGKSTLLDYIRKSNVVDGEVGGITQRLSAYEVRHKTKDGKELPITFLDTPGHAAFTAMRQRGAKVADIAVLVVSAEDGVKPQTLEALKTITEAKIPYIVAINKIDREGADVDRTKVSLAEAGVYVEGFGGSVSFTPISAKTGAGVSDLLDLMLLTAELEDLKADSSHKASGIVIEANLDKKKGVTATLVIKDGTLKTGSYLVAGSAMAPVRIMENFLAKPIKEATFSSPIRIIGWNMMPEVGAEFKTFDSKKEAEQYIETLKKTPIQNNRRAEDENMPIIPVVVKAAEVGGLDAVVQEINKLKNDKIKIKIIQSGVGDITENDIKIASGKPETLVIGFSTKTDAAAKSAAEKIPLEIHTFEIIYKLSEWLEEIVAARTPKTQVEESIGLVKVLKQFSKVKDRQVLGGRVEKGSIEVGAEVKILRRDFEIGRGRVRELQRQKNKVGEVPEGQEFGTMIESKIEIAPGDRLESFKIVEK